MVGRVSLLVLLACLLGVQALTKLPVQVHHPKVHFVDSLALEGGHKLVHLGSNPDTNTSGNGLLWRIEITLGTPGQKFLVQLDTGSTLLAVPSIQCVQCDSNSPDPFFNASLSSSYKQISCSSSDCSNKVCYSNTDQCDFLISYADQSYITGIYAYETLSFAGLNSKVIFGLTENNSQDFEAPYADGIMGLAYNNKELTCSPNCAPPVIDSIIKSNGLTDIFTLLFGFKSGYMTIGGIDESQYTGTIQYADVIQEDFYTIEFKGASVGKSKMFEAPPSKMSIVDSGTSELVLATPVFAAIQKYFQTNYCNLPGVCGAKSFFGKNSCVLPASNSTILNGFPDITLYIGDAQVVLAPQNYFFPLQDNKGNTAYCFFIADAGGNDSILGDPLFVDKLVIFDRVQNRVGFAQGVFN